MRPEDSYQFERNVRAVVFRIGTVAAVGSSTLDVDVPGGRLTGVATTFTPMVGARVVVQLDRDKALAVGPVKDAPVVWTPTTGMKVFQARQTATQSIPNSAYTPLRWDVVEDPYGSWASGTPTRFKPTFAGQFLVNGGISFAALTPTYAQQGSHRIAAWYRNGTLLTLADTPDPAMIALAVVARPYLVSLNGTTDYIELSAWHDAGVALNTSVASGYASSVTVTFAGT